MACWSSCQFLHFNRCSLSTRKREKELPKQNDPKAKTNKSPISTQTIPRNRSNQRLARLLLVIATVKIPKSFLSPTHIHMWMRQTHKTVHCKRGVELGSPQIDLRISTLQEKKFESACSLCITSLLRKALSAWVVESVLAVEVKFVVLHSFTDCFCPLRRALNFPSTSLGRKLWIFEGFCLNFSPKWSIFVTIVWQKGVNCLDHFGYKGFVIFK